MFEVYDKSNPSRYVIDRLKVYGIHKVNSGRISFIMYINDEWVVRPSEEYIPVNRHPWED